MSKTKEGILQRKIEQLTICLEKNGILGPCCPNRYLMENWNWDEAGGKKIRVEEVKFWTSFRLVSEEIRVRPIMIGATTCFKEILLSLGIVAAILELPMTTGSLRILKSHPEMIKQFMIQEEVEKITGKKIKVFLGNAGISNLANINIQEHEELITIKDLLNWARKLRLNSYTFTFNPEHEAAQPNGDHLTKKQWNQLLINSVKVAQILQEKGLTVIFKTVGNGVSEFLTKELSKINKEFGVFYIIQCDGKGGTNWIKVAQKRSGKKINKSGEEIGTPTDISVLNCCQGNFQTIIAGGGITDSETALRALSLGADMVSIARKAVIAVKKSKISSLSDLYKSDLYKLFKGIINGCMEKMAHLGVKSISDLHQQRLLVRSRKNDYCQVIEEFDPLLGKKVQTAYFFVPSAGCEKAKNKGPCLMCGFYEPWKILSCLEEKPTVSQILRLFKEFVRPSIDFYQAKVLRFLIGGSILNEDEFPLKALITILRNRLPASIVRVEIESRPEHISQYAIQKLLDVMPSKVKLVVCLGVETSDETYRNHLLKKGITNEQIKKSVLALKNHGILCGAYILAGIPGLKFYESIFNVIMSLKWCKKVGFDIVTINPTVVPLGNKRMKSFQPLKWEHILKIINWQIENLPDFPVTIAQLDSDPPSKIGIGGSEECEEQVQVFCQTGQLMIN